MKALRVLYYIGLALSVIIILGTPIRYSLWDLFTCGAIVFVVIIFGFMFAMNSSSNVRMMQVLSSVFLVFSMVNMGHYYLLNIVKEHEETTITLRDQAPGWLFIVVFIFLLLSTFFTGFIFGPDKSKEESDENDTYINYD